MSGTASDFRCQRCDSVAPGVERGTTYGGHEAVLCMHCRNLLRQRFAGSEVQTEFLRCEVRERYLTGLALAGEPPKQAHWKELVVEKAEVERQAFALAADFCVSLNFRAIEESVDGSDREPEEGGVS